MNSYKLNGIVGHTCRAAICESLKIRHVDIYKVVKKIDSNGVIETADGTKFKLKLEEIQNYERTRTNSTEQDTV